MHHYIILIISYLQKILEYSQMSIFMLYHKNIGVFSDEHIYVISHHDLNKK